MNKTVKRVFFLIAVLVAIFLAWQIIFNKGGIIVTAYTALENTVNTQWQKVAGGGSKLLPDWNVDTNGKGSEIDTGSDG